MRIMIARAAGLPPDNVKSENKNGLIYSMIIPEEFEEEEALKELEKDIEKNGDFEEKFQRYMENFKK